MRNIYYGFISGNVLKLIACAAMLIDHIGAFLFPDVIWLRLVGRVAMPLFAFTLAEGCFYTRSKLRHTLLIAGLGLVTSGVASFVTGTVEGDILITFTLSCLIIWALDALKMACCAVAEQYQAVDTAQALATKSLTAALSDSSGELQSQTVGSWSKSYRSGGESAAQAATAAASARSLLSAAAAQYLAGTGLLYRGGGCCVPTCCDAL